MFAAIIGLTLYFLPLDEEIARKLA